MISKVVGKEIRRTLRVTLLGIQHISFTNSNGEKINGNNAFIAYKDENVQGMRTEKLFIKEGIEIPKDIKLNDAIEVSFNMKGKVEALYKA